MKINLIIADIFVTMFMCIKRLISQLFVNALQQHAHWWKKTSTSCLKCRKRTSAGREDNDRPGPFHTKEQLNSPRMVLKRNIDASEMLLLSAGLWRLTLAYSAATTVSGRRLQTFLKNCAPLKKKSKWRIGWSLSFNQARPQRTEQANINMQISHACRTMSEGEDFVYVTLSANYV